MAIYVVSVVPGPEQRTFEVETAPLAPGASEVVTLPIAEAFTLFTVEVSAAARVRAYLTAQACTDDAARAVGVAPTDAVYNALVFETNLPYKGLLSERVFEDLGADGGSLSIRVTNAGASAAAITLTLVYLPLKGA